MVNVLLSKRILFVLVLFGTTAFGQSEFTLTGLVLDSMTNDPLPYSTIIYKRKHLGTSADQRGFFKLSLHDYNPVDTITISHIGYQDINVILSEGIPKSVFLLKPQVKHIQEIIVSYTEFDPKESLKSIISEYNSSKRNDPHIAISHYSEKVRDNTNEYLMFMESIGYSIFTGFKQDASPLTNYMFFCENTRCIVSNPQWINFQSNDPEIRDIFPGCGTNLNFLRYIETYGILSNKYFHKYEVRIDSLYKIGMDDICKFRFKLRSNIGTITANLTNLELMTISCTSDDFWSPIFSKRLRATINIGFDYYNSTPFVSYIQSSYKYHGLEHSISLKVLTQKLNQFIISDEDYWNFNDYNLNPYIEYEPNHWRNSKIELDIDYQKIESDLTKCNLPLDEQFANRSGTWYTNSIRKNENTIKFIKMLKGLF